MRATWILVVLAACHSSAAPTTVAPNGPTPCARASDHMVQALLDRLPQNNPVPTDEADAFRNLIRERCEQDRWSAEATRCLIAMNKVDDAATCAPLLTDAQQEALVRDQTAQFGAPGDAPATSSGGSPDAEGKAAPPPTVTPAAPAAQATPQPQR